MKNALLPVAVGVAILGCVLAFYANFNSSSLRKMLDSERHKRFTSEQQLLKAQQQIASLQTELGESKSKMASIEKILNDGRELAVELDEIKKDRDTLKQQVENLRQSVVPAVIGE